MANQPYLVVRLVPSAPIDGATFSTYLDNLALQAYDAYSGAPRSGLAFSSPLTVFQWATGSSLYLSSVSAITASSTKYVSAGNYGTTLTLESTAGVSVGSYIFSADQTTIPVTAGLTVAAVTASGVQLSGGNLPQYVPAGTVVSFLGQASQDGLPSTPGGSFELMTSSAATELDQQLLMLHFTDTTGVLVGMTVTGSFVAAGTIVAAATPTTVTLSQPLSGSPATVTFALPAPYASITLTPTSGARLHAELHVRQDRRHCRRHDPVPGTRAHQARDDGQRSDGHVGHAVPAIAGGADVRGVRDLRLPAELGIAQHTEVIDVQFDFWGFGEESLVIPAAVATALIPLDTATSLPDYLDITISATRGSEIIPSAGPYYNVKVSADDDVYSSPDLYQDIPASSTSLYLVLPPPPGLNAISLDIPSDGSPPPFDALYTAMANAFANDPIPNVSDLSELVNASSSCTRIAYDIVWSYQGNLPQLPDPIESLYTNPPNPGGGGTTTTSPGSNKTTNSNNFEQDRQQFEGALSSFYATRNATAERLTKFVAAASAALACEQASASASTALVEFPVDPSATFAGSVDSKIMLGGLGRAGPSGLNFGVPAAFFYALGTSLDKSTKVTQRFQMATGDTIDRLLQQFETAVDTLVLLSTEQFKTPALTGLKQVSSYQAARRLVALGVSAASNSPAVTVLPGTALASLVNDWLLAGEPASDQNPPPSSALEDFTIWTQQLAVQDPRGYLDIDLNALTQGYVIPPFTASPAAATDPGAVLTFPAGLGIGVGMPVSGPGIAAGTIVTGVSITAASGGTPAQASVMLSAPVTGSVTASTVLVFNFAALPVTATTTADCPSGSALLSLGDTSAIVAGMSVLGTAIAQGTTALTVTATTVTLSTAVTADVPAGSQATFVAATATLLPWVTADTIADCPGGTSQLSLGDTSAIVAGMSVLGTAIAQGTIVVTVSATSITLSTPVAADVPAGSLIAFAFLPSTLADQIATWLPGTTTQPSQDPTVATLKQVTAAQWSGFFTQAGGPQWLPPFTQPVAPGASSGQAAPQAGYVAARIRAFVRAVQQFFTVSSVTTTAQLPPGRRSAGLRPARL